MVLFFPALKRAAAAAPPPPLPPSPPPPPPPPPPPWWRKWRGAPWRRQHVGDLSFFGRGASLLHSHTSTQPAIFCRSSLHAQALGAHSLSPSLFHCNDDAHFLPAHIRWRWPGKEEEDKRRAVYAHARSDGARWPWIWGKRTGPLSRAWPICAQTPRHRHTALRARLSPLLFFFSLDPTPPLHVWVACSGSDVFLFFLFRASLTSAFLLPPSQSLLEHVVLGQRLRTWGGALAPPQLPLALFFRWCTRSLPAADTHEQATCTWTELRAGKGKPRPQDKTSSWLSAPRPPPAKSRR